MTATESLLPEIINDFFNKICQKQTHALQQAGLFDHLVGSQQYGGGIVRMSTARLQGHHKM